MKIVSIEFQKLFSNSLAVCTNVRFWSFVFNAISIWQMYFLHLKCQQLWQCRKSWIYHHFSNNSHTFALPVTVHFSTIFTAVVKGDWMSKTTCSWKDSVYNFEWYWKKLLVCKTIISNEIVEKRYRDMLQYTLHF